MLLPPTWAQMTLGTDFWFTFLDNYQNTSAQKRVYISSINGATGTISIPALAWTQNFTVPAMGNVLITVPNSAVGKAIHVTASDTIAVWALHFYPYTSDATVVLPVEALGTEYVVLTFSDQSWVSSSYPNQIAIVGIANNTQVTIDPPFAPPFNITLNQGQVYMYTAPGSQDLTGTVIRVTNAQPTTCKPIAVFAGARCTSICTSVGTFTCCCDHIFEQMHPVSSWGTQFVVVPFMSRNFDIVRVVAYFNNTQVTVNGAVVATLNQGQYWQGTINTPTVITTSQPASVAQYSVSGNCDFTTGDPFYIVIPPLEQRLNRIIFDAFPFNVINNYYVNIVVPTNGVNNVWLNGNNISGSFAPVPSNPAWSYAQINIASGTYVLQADSGAITTIYGFGSWDSYGYLAGSAVEPWVEIVYDTPLCPGDTIAFWYIVHNAGPISVNSPMWVFNTTGDTVSGDTAYFYIPATADTITITLYYVAGSGACGAIQQTFTMTVPRPLQPTFACAGDTLTLYPDTLMPGPYIWWTGDSASPLQWLVPDTLNTGDTLWITLYYPEVCNFTDTSYLLVSNVNIQRTLEPLPPLCYLQDTLTIQVDSLWGGYPPYSVSYTLTGGNGTLIVDSPNAQVWGADTFQVILVYGDSTGCRWRDTITIPVLPEFRIALPDTWLCQYADTILLSPTLTNGFTPFTYTWWVQGGTILCDTCATPKLVATTSQGTIIVEVTDSFGCIARDTATFEGKPSPLFNLPDTIVCWHDNGSAIINPSDNNSPYQVEWQPPSAVSCDTCLSTTLIHGGTDQFYRVTVTNTWGCSWTDTFWLWVDWGPTVQIYPGDTVVLWGSQLTIYALTDATFFLWTGDLPTNVSNQADSFTLDARAPQFQFILQGWNERGCYWIDTTTILTVEATCDEQPFIPNAFTPNGDGINDILYVYTRVPDARIDRWEIYTRWGELVFSASDLRFTKSFPFQTTIGWDGTHQQTGALLRSDVYVYYLEYTCKGQRQFLRGDVTLIR